MEKEKISLKTMLAILLVVLVMGGTFLAVYHFTSSIIVAYNVDTMMEINRHDNTAIDSLVSIRVSELESAAGVVRQAKPQTQAELYNCLAQANTQIASRRVMLIDTEGNIYSSSGVTAGNEGMRNLAEQNPDGFVSRYDSAGFGGLVAISEISSAGTGLLYGICMVPLLVLYSFRRSANSRTASGPGYRPTWFLKPAKWITLCPFQ